MICHTSEIRVRYADTDQMKNVYYGKYFEYFEQGRTELLRALGMPYRVLENRGYLLPVIEAYAHYQQPARYDDLLQVETRIEGIPTARIRLDYSIRRGGDPSLLVEGYTVHAFTDASTRKPMRPPDSFVSAITNAFNQAKRSHA